MKKPEILIVDDRIENLISMEAILEDIDAVIVNAKSGNEAVAESLEREFALILMDVQMPEMDGFETMKLIRKSEKNQETPVIFLSAIYSDDYYKIKGIQEGAVDFMTKPVVEAILLGKVKVFLTMFEQKKKLHEQMKEIASLNRDMESFNRILIHDLKQPLNGVMGMSEIILAMEKDHLSGELKELLEHIHASGVNMNNLINDVLELLTTKNSSSEIEEMDLQDIIEEVSALYGGKTDKKLEIEYTNLPVIKSRRTHLKSIFRNLIGNSIKYNNNDVVKVKIEYSDLKGNNKFSLSDNGIGIPPEKFGDIFKPFIRVNADPKYTGTGIGLSIVYSAVEKLNGKIFVENSGDEGTTICMILPDYK